MSLNDNYCPRCKDEFPSGHKCPSPMEPKGREFAEHSKDCPVTLRSVQPYGNCSCGADALNTAAIQWSDARVKNAVAVALEKEREKWAYEYAHTQIEFYDGDSGITRVARFEAGEYEGSIPDAWVVEDDYRPVKEFVYWRMKQVIGALQTDRRRLREIIADGRRSKKAASS